MFHPLRASIQIKFAGGVVCSTADTMEGERSGGSEFRFRSGRPTGSKDRSILWKAIYFSDLADIVAYFMRARPSLRHLGGGVGVVDRARKARCACFAPKSHMNTYGYKRTTVTLWRLEAFVDVTTGIIFIYMYMYRHDVGSDPSDT